PPDRGWVTRSITRSSSAASWSGIDMADPAASPAIRALLWSNEPVPPASMLDELAALIDVPGVVVERARTVDECLTAMTRADLLVLGNVPPALARRIAGGAAASERLRGLH